MKVLDYGAVEDSFALFGSNILRKGLLCQRVQLYQSIVGGPYSFYTVLCG